MSYYLSAREAAARLGVSPATLYAYVSRGLLHSEPVPGEPRQRRYRREEVEQLAARRVLRRTPEQAPAQALDWGLPVLPSALTLIRDGRLYYRGEDALRLARDSTLEAVAARLWLDDPGAATALFADSPAPLPVVEHSAGALVAAQQALVLSAASDLAALDQRPAAQAASGARVLRLLAGMLAGATLTGPLAAGLGRRWGLPEDAVAGLEAALIVCADHELNVSAFTARCVASAGANLYEVVAAALGCLKGTRHGGMTARVEALLDEVTEPARSRAVLAARLRRGEAVPGFGHRLYPRGDPRGAMLLALARELAPHGAASALGEAVVTAAGELLDEAPTLDLGLVVLCRALGLAPGSALAVFALGRSVGWIGHAMEQYASGQLIRPRAAYTGRLPEDG